MVKVSCSCISNMSVTISWHNKRLLRPRATEYGCNCRMIENFPLQNQCLTPNVISRDDVENNKNKGTNKGTKIYFCLAETLFKQRFRNRNKDFIHEQCRKSTESPKYMWSLKAEKIIPEIRWSIVEMYMVKQKLIFVHYA